MPKNLYQSPSTTNMTFMNDPTIDGFDKRGRHNPNDSMSYLTGDKNNKQSPPKSLGKDYAIDQSRNSNLSQYPQVGVPSLNKFEGGNLKT